MEVGSDVEVTHEYLLGRRTVATLTVIAALLPMLFVSGLMGPYMAPIPANASAAMLFSFVVAMVVAPWLMLKLALLFRPNVIVANVRYWVKGSEPGPVADHAPTRQESSRWE